CDGILVSFTIFTRSSHLRSSSTRLMYAFLFISYVDYLDLRSFPTRRSSDLLAARVAVRPAHRPARPAARDAPRPGVPRDDRGRQDRKSTRLNSSHVKISYAVFCLKKKKNIRLTTHNDQVYPNALSCVEVERF